MTKFELVHQIAVKTGVEQEKVVSVPLRAWLVLAGALLCDYWGDFQRWGSRSSIWLAG
jgi:hypothetical protein